jgi:transposase
VSQQVRSTFVVREPSEVVQALVGLKDVRVLHYRRCGPDVELMIEQVVEQIRCPSCGGATQVKERPVVRYVDLPVYGTPMRLAWRKHRMRCVDVDCSRRSFVLQDHRIAAKGCLLTTRAAKWATVQVGGGRTVCEVAAELACDWHTVNDAVTIYGAALLGRGPQTADQDSGDRVGRNQLRPAQRARPGRLRDHGRRRRASPDHRHPAVPELSRRRGFPRQTGR